MQTHISVDIKKKAVLLTVLAGFMWGTSFPAIKIGLQYMDAYTFVILISRCLTNHARNNAANKKLQPKL
ncbi:MAG: hypothetical protein QXD19_01490 [Candidatus Bathyarchaeia archaeon]